MVDDPIVDAAPRATRRKARTPLALIIIGCAMITAAIALVVDGAVADDRAPDHNAPATLEASTQRTIASHTGDQSRGSEGRTVETRARYRADITRDDPLLAAQVADSVAGGGVVTGADVVLSIQKPSRRR